jgi:hypothetical protein
LRVKNGGYRKIFVSDELDRVYGEYLWRLCDAGAEEAVGDLDSWWVFVNLSREPRFAPMRAETVAWQVLRLRRRFPDQLPADFTPHWLRHYVDGWVMWPAGVFPLLGLAPGPVPAT